MTDKRVQVGIGVIVFKDDTFLIMQRRGAHGSGTWAPPGGKMDYSESFEDTARREVKEETGLNIKNIRFGGVTNDLFSKDGKHFVTIWIVSDYHSGTEAIMEPEKCVAMDWFTFDNLPTPLFTSWENLALSPFFKSIQLELTNAT